jgi:hypothetical protein
VVEAHYDEELATLESLDMGSSLDPSMQSGLPVSSKQLDRVPDLL